MRIILLAGAVVALGAGLMGCVGHDTMLFTTNTSIGVDLDAKPPTTSIAYSRQELVIAPEYQNGDVPPVLATIKNDFLGFASKQTFLTGYASLLMAYGMFKNEELDVKTATIRVPPATITITPSAEELKVIQAEKEYKRTYFFGTSTVFGVKVNWNAATGVPDALALGLKRKELAVVPIMENIGPDGKTVTVATPSLFASSSVEAELNNIKEARAGAMALFATGKAAEYLAGNAQVRRAFLEPSLLGENVKQVRALQSQDTDERKTQRENGKKILDLYATLPDARKGEMRKAAVDLKLSTAEDENTFKTAMTETSITPALPNRSAVMEQLYNKFKQ